MKKHGGTLRQAIDRAAEICRQRGERLTPLRRKVLELILRQQTPLKAYDIMKRINDGLCKPPTVYRTLDFLLAQGLVHRISSRNAWIGCRHPTLSHDCHFMICDRCDQVDECCSADLERTIRRATDKSHFNHRRAALEIYGLCRRCQKRPS